MAAVLISILSVAFNAMEVSSSSCPSHEDFLPPDYNRRVAPIGGKPLEIELGIFIESFGSVDIAKMDFETFSYVTQTWTDNRLVNLSAESQVTLEGNDVSCLWVPDIYCINCKVSNMENGRNTKQGTAHVDQQGNVYMSFMAAVVASCRMDLHKFPFDTQQCSLSFSSYAYNASKITYRWAGKPILQQNLLDQFYIVEEKTETHLSKYVLGDFVVSKVSFKFKRRVGYYMLQIYIPTLMLVCFSWTMFCLNHTHSGERITIGVTLFLTMIFLNGQANTSLPRVSYVKSIDIYMVVSLAEVLFIIIESIIVTKMIVGKESRRTKRRKLRRQRMHSQKNLFHEKEDYKLVTANDCKGSTILQEEISDSPMVEKLASDVSWAPMFTNQVEMKSNELKTQSKPVKGQNRVEKASVANSTLTQWYPHHSIEKISVVLLPVSYVGFNAWYWLTFLNKDDHW